MKEMLAQGYKVVIESMFGDLVVEDEEMAECYECDSALDRVDEEEKVAYYYDTEDYDD